MWRESFLAFFGILLVLIPAVLQAADAGERCLDPIVVTGDRDYGAHLAGECVTCHRATGAAQGIPPITGWAPAEFMSALQAYRCGTRQHKVMQMVAGQLGDAEIAALASYFKDLD